MPKKRKEDKIIASLNHGMGHLEIKVMESTHSREHVLLTASGASARASLPRIDIKTDHLRVAWRLLALVLVYASRAARGAATTRRRREQVTGAARVFARSCGHREPARKTSQASGPGEHGV